jgi:hypothetical protein
MCMFCCSAQTNTSVRQANLILGRTGLPFRRDESSHLWVRDGKQLERMVRYIEGNPERAGLVERAAMWPWSSALEIIVWQGMALPFTSRRLVLHRLKYVPPWFQNCLNVETPGAHIT